MMGFQRGRGWDFGVFLHLLPIIPAEIDIARWAGREFNLEKPNNPAPQRRREQGYGEDRRDQAGNGDQNRAGDGKTRIGRADHPGTFARGVDDGTQAPHHQQPSKHQAGAALDRHAEDKKSPADSRRDQLHQRDFERDPAQKKNRAGPEKARSRACLRCHREKPELRHRQSTPIPL